MCSEVSDDSFFTYNCLQRQFFLGPHFFGDFAMSPDLSSILSWPFFVYYGFDQCIKVIMCKHVIFPFEL